MGHRERRPDESVEDDMTEDVTQIEEAIAAYRAELVAEAELARGDLNEIEDHLRALIEELRDTRAIGEAIALARSRLGDPKQLAREHARVRTPFGAKLSRARAWSAAALVAPSLVLSAVAALQGHGGPGVGVHLLVASGMFAALVARRTWAWPILLGNLAGGLAWGAIALLAPPYSRWMIAQLACHAGAFAFLVPWRRGELSAASWALALLGPAYSAALQMFSVQLTMPNGIVFGNPAVPIAFVAVLVTGATVVWRTRWAAMTAVIAAIALASTAADNWDMTVRMTHSAVWRTLFLGQLVVGSCAAFASAVVIWRSRRALRQVVR